VTPLTFEQARAVVIEKLREAGVRGQTEMVSLLDADGRVLAEEVRADRDYPPQARSIRDGFAVRARASRRILPSAPARPSVRDFQPGFPKTAPEAPPNPEAPACGLLGGSR